MRTQKLLLVAVLCVIGFTSSTAHGQISLLMTFTTDASGITLGGLGIGSASVAFGNVRAFGGTVPTGVTKTRVGNTFVLSTPIDIQVTGVGIVTPTYTLAVKEATADPLDVFKWGGATVNSTGFVTLTTTAAYLTFIPWTFSIAVPFSNPPGAMSNTLNFVATGN
ncbi:MAG TPA: hypothetical protein VH088_21765 [Terriglobales bacterium]|jgi:hypothetical protein|nr:hypothetical protein [Terriglobales bacterium]